MLPPPFNDALVLAGPTASGKSQLGIELAQRLQAEIISMDSMSLYRGMDIGTAKPTLAQRAQVRHHLVDVLDPWESASVAWWLEQARRVSGEIRQRGKQVLFVGGTPLYLKALLLGLFDGPRADAALRQRLEAEAERAGTAALHQRLQTVDAAAAGRIHVNDRRRIIRALEVYELTGRPLSAWQTQWRDDRGASAEVNYACPPVLWLDLPRAELYARINQRVEAMFAAGLVEEVRALRSLGHPLSREAAQALGYKEVLGHLEGSRDLAATVGLVQTRSRNFAKRQLTWLRHLPNCRPVTPDLTQALWQSRMK